MCEICKIGNIQYEIYNNGEEVYYTEIPINNNSLSKSSVFTISDREKSKIIDARKEIVASLDRIGGTGVLLDDRLESLKKTLPQVKFENLEWKVRYVDNIWGMIINSKYVSQEKYDMFWKYVRYVKEEINNISNDKTENMLLSESQRTKIRDARKELLESLEKIGGKGVLLVDKLESLKKVLPQDKYKVLEWQVNYVDNIWGVIVNSKYVSQESYDNFWENFEYAKKEINSISNEIKTNDDGWKGCLFFIALLMLVIFIIYLFPVIITWLVWLFIINIPVIISKNGGDSGCVTTIFFFYALVGIANPLPGIVMIIVYIIEGIVFGIFNSSNDQKNKKLK